MSEILVHITRGGLVESSHRGSLTAVDDNGEIIFQLGDPRQITFWCSAAKPFQVLPLIEAGGIERFGFSPPEIALMTSSHGGEERHIDTVVSIFQKLKLSSELLSCGTAPPMSQAAANRLLKNNQSFSQLTNPCSGKHAAMLALALLKNYPLDNYIHPDHRHYRST